MLPSEPKKPKQRKSANAKKLALKNEAQFAKQVGGQRQPASGAFNGHKGDVKTADFLFEHKETGRESYSVTLQTLAKLTTESLAAGRRPALVIKFGVRAELAREWVCMRVSDFCEVINGKGT